MEGLQIDSDGFEYNYFEGITVGKNMYFVVGDNINNSRDSRDISLGFINISQVIGKKI